jgi:hypothetical protein
MFLAEMFHKRLLFESTGEGFGLRCTENRAIGRIDDYAIRAPLPFRTPNVRVGRRFCYTSALEMQ